MILDDYLRDWLRRIYPCPADVLDHVALRARGLCELVCIGKDDAGPLLKAAVFYKEERPHMKEFVQVGNC